jgi:hypothetical protein
VTHIDEAPHRMRWWDRQGLRGGLLAGIGFALVELLLMGIQHGPAADARLLRRIAATWIGPAALDADYPFGTVVVVGTIIHGGLSALFGLGFTWLTSTALAARLLRSRGTFLAAAALYGLVLWPFNVYLVAPFVGWEWFARETEPAVQAVSHLCYGLILGLYLERRAASRLVERAAL